ncbi:hypothetical protein MBLL_00460 (plasmid) [Methylobacterium bullatum]|uniref:Uncharacterized protein n=1 Tax=Methylobacterium bullatum TaxID=570505 RepID=A0A679JVV3_9HYPH|nr:hypothetical protein MBLL_00460 [Methylobacterium bullatum]
MTKNAAGRRNWTFVRIRRRWPTRNHPLHSDGNRQAQRRQSPTFACRYPRVPAGPSDPAHRRIAPLELDTTRAAQDCRLTDRARKASTCDFIACVRYGDRRGTPSSIVCHVNFRGAALRVPVTSGPPPRAAGWPCVSSSCRSGAGLGGRRGHRPALATSRPATCRWLGPKLNDKIFLRIRATFHLRSQWDAIEPRLRDDNLQVGEGGRFVVSVR